MKNTLRPHLSQSETGLDRFLSNLFYGTKPLIEKSFCSSGLIKPSLKSTITKNLNCILEGCAGFKIGKTGDSYIRTDYSDYRKSYNYMYLLYKSKSRKSVSAIEEHYIAKYMDMHPDYSENRRVNSPGKKMQSYNGYYYLYVVTRDVV
jgi:hypothetical protein